MAASYLPFGHLYRRSRHAPLSSKTRSLLVLPTGKMADVSAGIPENFQKRIDRLFPTHHWLPRHWQSSESNPQKHTPSIKLLTGKMVQVSARISENFQKRIKCPLFNPHRLPRYWQSGESDPQIHPKRPDHTMSPYFLVTAWREKVSGTKTENREKISSARQPPIL